MNVKRSYIIILIILTAQITTAQNIFFGQNKVQYRDFDWYYIQTADFDIYFYKDEDTLAIFAAEALNNAYNEIQEELNRIMTDRKLLLRLSYDSDTDQQVEVSTCLARELVYNIEHAIHHMAIIRMALIQEFPDINVDSNFGIAYSTIKFQQK